MACVTLKRPLLSLSERPFEPQSACSKAVVTTSSSPSPSSTVTTSVATAVIAAKRARTAVDALAEDGSTSSGRRKFATYSGIFKNDDPAGSGGAAASSPFDNAYRKYINQLTRTKVEQAVVAEAQHLGVKAFKRRIDQIATSSSSSSSSSSSDSDSRPESPTSFSDAKQPDQLNGVMAKAMKLLSVDAGATSPVATGANNGDSTTSRIQAHIAQLDRLITEMPATTAATTATAVAKPASIKRKPLFTLRQMTSICSRMCKREAEELRAEFEAVLHEQMSDQYNAFCAYIDHQIRDKFDQKVEAPSYLS